ncbi:MAG: CoA pyrophosphatase, partial [Betaproteobacteria bacterium]|nr:CoA pyrophosphatase [Betaproteobacteria bacterium]
MSLIPLSKLPNFDPKKVPVLGVDDHLPAVAVKHLSPEALKVRFNATPYWEPEIHREPPISSRRVLPAAVLIPLVRRAELMVLLTQRTAHLAHHSGQIAFPGGKIDAHDANAIEAALREAEEEVGLHRSFVQVLGTLAPYTTGSAFEVTPVVALVEAGFQLQLNP